MSFCKSYIECINKLEYALQMQREGKHEYLSIEKGCRDYISSCWYHIKKGLREGHEEINSRLDDDMKLKELTEEDIKRKARKILVEGCFKEGADRNFLKKYFRITDEELDKIIDTCNQSVDEVKKLRKEYEENK